MKYKLEYDNDNQILRVEVLGSLDAEDIPKVMAEVEHAFEGKTHRNILANLSADEAIGNSISKETRMVYKKYLEKNPFDKVAVLGANNVVRMVAKVVLAALGKRGSARFFGQEDKAIAWLKEEQNK